MRITNYAGINLALSVWLVNDDYDYNDDPSYISATGLLKPIRQAILVSRVPPAEREVDVEEFTSRALGNAIHDSMESAWKNNYRRNMRKLGYPDQVIDRVAINPDPAAAAASNSMIPVWLEQRAVREITVQGVTYKIGGKFDMIADWILHDNKSTSAWTFVGNDKDEGYQLQLSIYRWLNPDKVREDYAKVNFVFTDWSKMMARSNPKYPQKRVEERIIQLLSPADTEAWIHDRIMLLRRHKNDPDHLIPECTDKELWRSDPKYKYYSDPAKAGGRATKNFDSLTEANAHCAEKGRGVVVTVPGEPRACNFCPAFDACLQKDRYFT